MDTPQPTTKPRRTNSPQNRVILAYATQAETFLKTLSTDPTLSEILAQYGYDAADYAEGLAKVDALRQAIGSRAEGKGNEERLTDAQEEQIATARDDYAAFRQIARAAFPDPADRQALGLTGEVPDAIDPFLTTADTSYAAGQKAPYTEKLTKRGYPAARLQQLAATIDTLTDAISDQNEAEGQAINTTATRNTAYKALQSFMRELKGTTKGALRGKPALLAKLKF